MRADSQKYLAGWRSLSGPEVVRVLARTACLLCNASASSLPLDRVSSFGRPSRGSAHPGAEPWPMQPRTTMPGGSTPMRLHCFHRLHALDNSKPFAVGSAAKIRTSRASCRYHGFPCKRHCLHRSFQDDMDCLNAHRRRTGEPLCWEYGTDLEAREHQV